jgi:transcriptional regulator with XRE-family HTH domain
MDPTKRLIELARVERLRRNGEARRIRLAAGVSARQVALALRVAPNTILRWEEGLSRPRPEAALQWLAVLDQLAAGLGDDAKKEEALVSA